MSIKHAKIDGGLFRFNDPTENIVDPIPPKPKKKKGKNSFYIKALDRISSSLDIKVAENTTAVDIEYPITAGNIDETIFKKNEIIYNGDDCLKLPKGAQIAQPKQSLEGSYKSIWKKPRIRPNIDFEEEIDPDEELDFDDDEEIDCTTKVPPPIYTTYKHYIQTETPPSFTPEKPQKETPENVLKVQEEPIEEESVGKKTYVPGTDGKYVEVVDESMKGKSLFEDIELSSTSLSSEEINTIHKNSNDLYYTGEEKIIDKPINEV